LIAAKIHDIKVQRGTLQILMHFALVRTLVVSWLLVSCDLRSATAKIYHWHLQQGLLLNCISQRHCALHSLLDQLPQAVQTPPGVAQHTLS